RVPIVGRAATTKSARARVLATTRRRHARDGPRRVRPRAGSAGRAGIRRRAPVTAAVIQSPFKGLAPFGDSYVDALLFFGRSRETETIAANLQAARLTVLFGPAGVGKTSVLRAGVAHRLRQEGDVDVKIVDSWVGAPVGGLRSAVEDR